MLSSFSLLMSFTLHVAAVPEHFEKFDTETKILFLDFFFFFYASV